MLNLYKLRLLLGNVMNQFKWISIISADQPSPDFLTCFQLDSQEQTPGKFDQGTKISVFYIIDSF